ncbi:sigma factor-like helix-turn-helix DNA-binding protein [Nocardia sp. NPDC004750]
MLLLRDVLGMPAAEVAGVLDTSTAAVKSTLQRVRARLTEVSAAAEQAVPPSEPGQRALLEEYLTAFLRADPAAIERLLHRDAVLEMPPSATWFSGKRTCVAYLAEHVLQGQCRDTDRLQRPGEPPGLVPRPGDYGDIRQRLCASANTVDQRGLQVLIRSAPDPHHAVGQGDVGIAQRHDGLPGARRAGQPGGTGVVARDQDLLFGIQEGHPVLERPLQRRIPLRREHLRPIEQGGIRCALRRFLELQQVVFAGRLVGDGVRDGLCPGGSQVPLSCADHPIELARPGHGEPAVHAHPGAGRHEQDELHVMGDQLLAPELQSAEPRLDIAADLVEFGRDALGEAQREKSCPADQQRMGVRGGQVHRVAVDEQVSARFGQRLGEKCALVRCQAGDAGQRVRDT